MNKLNFLVHRVSTKLISLIKKPPFHRNDVTVLLRPLP